MWRTFSKCVLWAESSAVVWFGWGGQLCFDSFFLSFMYEDSCVARQELHHGWWITNNSCPRRHRQPWNTTQQPFAFIAGPCSQKIFFTCMVCDINTSQLGMILYLFFIFWKKSLLLSKAAFILSQIQYYYYLK